MNFTLLKKEIMYKCTHSVEITKNWPKFRESKGFTKENTRVDLTNFWDWETVFFSFFDSVVRCCYFHVFPRTILRALVMQTIQGFVNPVTILPRILQSCGRPENRKFEKKDEKFKHNLNFFLKFPFLLYDMHSLHSFSSRPLFTLVKSNAETVLARRIVLSEEWNNNHKTLSH